MGLFGSKNSKEEPKEEHVYFTKLPKDGSKLNSYDNDLRGDKTHPVVVLKINEDGTSDVIGCTTKYKQKLKDVKLDTTPEMKKDTYARVYDGTRKVSTASLEQKGEQTKCNNIQELKKKKK